MIQPASKNIEGALGSPAALLTRHFFVGHIEERLAAERAHNHGVDDAVRSL